MSVAQIYTYKTIELETVSEFKDRGSKFIGFAIPIQTIEDIKKYLKQLKELHPKAVHYCYAYRLGFDKTNFRANDDGEPSGSAGKPILGQIDSFDLTNVLIVVVRYFGGTLLGVPGLINAYKSASQDTLEQATIIEKNIESVFQIEYDYTIMNDVMRVIKQFDSNVIKQKMNLFCELEVGIPLKNEAQFIEKISEIRSANVIKK
jgi:uncharacterized YigZ family protein